MDEVSSGDEGIEGINVSCRNKIILDKWINLLLWGMLKVWDRAACCLPTYNQFFLCDGTQQYDIPTSLFTVTYQIKNIISGLRKK